MESFVNPLCLISVADFPAYSNASYLRDLIDEAKVQRYFDVEDYKMRGLYTKI